MTHMQDSAALHEKAVQAVAKNELDLPIRHRNSPRVLAKTTRHVVVHPEAMAAARRSMRPGQRLVIVSETEVRIVNR